MDTTTSLLLQTDQTAAPCEIPLQPTPLVARFSFLDRKRKYRSNNRNNKRYENRNSSSNISAETSKTKSLSAADPTQTKQQQLQQVERTTTSTTADLRNNDTRNNNSSNCNKPNVQQHQQPRQQQQQNVVVNLCHINNIQTRWYRTTTSSTRTKPTTAVNKFNHIKRRNSKIQAYTTSTPTNTNCNKSPINDNTFQATAATTDHQKQLSGHTVGNGTLSTSLGGLGLSQASDDVLKPGSVLQPP